MNKTVILYVAVDNKDAIYYLTDLFDKIHRKVSIIRLNMKTLILETDDCIVGTFIINSPHRTKTLRGAANYFCQSDKPFKTWINRIDRLHDSLQYRNLWLGIGANEISKEQVINILINGESDADNG